MRVESFERRQGGRPRGVLLLAAVLVLGNLGCSASGSVGVGDKGVTAMRTRSVDHEPCDIESKSAERVDANGDGQPDLSVVKDGSKELCRAADLDFDGRIDMWTYLDAAGKVRRRELDYDRDGHVDEIQLFKSGEIAEKHRASTPARRLDTWEFYTAGRLVRAERDSDSNGRVDQWWDYKTPDCPLIRSDGDGNGEPDPGTEVDYCKESGYRPPEPAAPATTPMLQKETQALPTETSNRPESAAPSGSEGDSKSGAGESSSSGAKAGATKTSEPGTADNGSGTPTGKTSGSENSGKGTGK